MKKCCLVWWVLISAVTSGCYGQNLASATWKYNCFVSAAQADTWNIFLTQIGIIDINKRSFKCCRLLWLSTYLFLWQQCIHLLLVANSIRKTHWNSGRTFHGTQQWVSFVSVLFSYLIKSPFGMWWKKIRISEEVQPTNLKEIWDTIIFGKSFTRTMPRRRVKNLMTNVSLMWYLQVTVYTTDMQFFSQFPSSFFFLILR